MGCPVGCPVGYPVGYPVPLEAMLADGLPLCSARLSCCMLLRLLLLPPVPLPACSWMGVCWSACPSTLRKLGQHGTAACVPAPSCAQTTTGYPCRSACPLTWKMTATTRCTRVRSCLSFAPCRFMCLTSPLHCPNYRRSACPLTWKMTATTRCTRVRSCLSFVPCRFMCLTSPLHCPNYRRSACPLTWKMTATTWCTRTTTTRHSSWQASRAHCMLARLCRREGCALCLEPCERQLRSKQGVQRRLLSNPWSQLRQLHAHLQTMPRRAARGRRATLRPRTPMRPPTTPPSTPSGSPPLAL